MKTNTKASVILDELILAYLRIQIECLKDKTLSMSVRTDYIRANLRNKIANFTNLDCSTIQNHIESIANNYVNNKLSVKESIKMVLSLY